MSWQASRLVVDFGPEDHKLYRLCAVIAESANAKGRACKIGRRLLADRCGVTYYGVGKLIERAVEGEWVVIEHMGDGSGQSVYALGPMIFERDLARRGALKSRANGGTSRGIPREVIDDPLESAGQRGGGRADLARFDAQNRARTVLSNTVRRTGAARTAKGGAPVRRERTSPPVPPPPPPGNDGLEVVDVGHDGGSCVVSHADFEAARQTVRSRGRTP